MNGRNLGSYVAASLCLFMLFLTYFPIVWLALMSVSPEPLSGVPGQLTARWYESLFADQRWLGPLGTSVWIGTLVGLACALISLIVARQIPRERRVGILLIVFLMPLFIPGVLMGIGLFFYYRVGFGLTMGNWSLVLGHFVWAFPFAMLVLLISTSRFDSRLSDAAADLGASPWRAFVDIELPFIKSGIVAAGLFGFLLSFNELPRSLLLNGGVSTLPLFEWAQASGHTSNVPLVYALSTLILFGSLILTLTAFWFLFGRNTDN